MRQCSRYSTGCRRPRPRMWHCPPWLRVGRARELLQFGNASIDRVAWEVGYSDPGAFRKVFTRIVGLSPSAGRWLGAHFVSCYPAKSESKRRAHDHTDHRCQWPDRPPAL
ncbi:helix-turn-helix domain-containing protein [Billgrantia montanilacus]|uniref:helix-turn-helix domain-containing protein n=1 Tax=Billgrantia montanilacus TaxID=2282305 RepID=UPI003BEED049